MRSNSGEDDVITRPTGLRQRRRAKTCFVHIGTHKTGSTAIQQYLAEHAAALASRGILVPRSGRLAESVAGCGHHCIAWDVLGSDPAAPVDASLELLIEEIRTAGLPTVCISSEEFAHLFALPNNMQRLKAGLRGIGYRAVVVVYLRPQADYLEALYAEIAQHAPVRDFWACYREVLAHGAVKFWDAGRFPAAFDYEQMLLGPFRRIFGVHNVVVRPFRRFDPSAALIRDFLNVVGAAPESRPASAPAAANARGAFPAVAAAIARNRAAAGYGAARNGEAAGYGAARNGEAAGYGAATDEDAALGAIGAGPFEVLRAQEIARLTWRFARGNLLLFVRHRVFIGCVSGVRLRRLWSARAEAAARVRYLRSLFAFD